MVAEIPTCCVSTLNCASVKVFTRKSPFYITHSFFKRKFTIHNGMSSLCGFTAIFGHLFGFFLFSMLTPLNSSVSLCMSSSRPVNYIYIYILFFGDVFMSIGMLFCAVTDEFALTTVERHGRPAWSTRACVLLLACLDMLASTCERGMRCFLSSVVAQRLGCCHCCGSSCRPTVGLLPQLWQL